MKDLTINASVDCDLPPAFVGRHLIGGDWVESAAWFERVSPSHGMVVSRSTECGEAETTGTVWTNTWRDGYPELAFGGFKQSGQGREIGRYGFEEFLEVKSVVMRIGRSRSPWVNGAEQAQH